MLLKIMLVFLLLKGQKWHWGLRKGSRGGRRLGAGGVGAGGWELGGWDNVRPVAGVQHGVSGTFTWGKEGVITCRRGEGHTRGSEHATRGRRVMGGEGEGEGQM